ncbi:MAG: enoyl-[acyl-carrier protein] reductase II [Flavobacteriales bacterium]|jgi:enoyl-[acyl-carrier protein] reductase II
MQNRIRALFKIQYPIIQAGMIWCSGWELASAVSNAGGLGVIGAGSMYPEILRTHIQKCKAATDKPFAINIPLLYPDIDKLMEIIVDEMAPIVFTSAGNPKTWTKFLQKKGIVVVHVVSNVKFALKSELAGVDAIVAEGFEAGGHNGREETTTLCLIPQVCNAVKIPVIAAGGVGDGRAMAAVFALGAEGAQIGSRFVASEESSAHGNFKNAVVEAQEGATQLTLKELTPVRLLKNEFFNQVQEAYSACASPEQLKELLGRARAKKGMFEGDMKDGELEIGQVSGGINQVMPAGKILEEIWTDFQSTINRLAAL